MGTLHHTTTAETYTWQFFRENLKFDFQEKIVKKTPTFISSETK